MALACRRKGRACCAHLLGSEGKLRGENRSLWCGNGSIQVDRDIKRNLIRRGQINFPVTVEVPGRDRVEAYPNPFLSG